MLIFHPFLIPVLLHGPSAAASFSVMWLQLVDAAFPPLVAIWLVSRLLL